MPEHLFVRKNCTHIWLSITYLSECRKIWLYIIVLICYFANETEYYGFIVWKRQYKIKRAKMYGRKWQLSLSDFVRL
jgi:hypothetical protein